MPYPDPPQQKKSATPAVAITTTSVTAAAPTVPMKTGIEKGAHDGPDFSPTNETPEAYTEMTIPDFPVRLPAGVVWGRLLALFCVVSAVVEPHWMWYHEPLLQKP